MNIQISTEAEDMKRRNSLPHFKTKIQDTYYTCYGMFTYVHRHKINILKMQPKERQNTEVFKKEENKTLKKPLTRL